MLNQLHRTGSSAQPVSTFCLHERGCSIRALWVACKRKPKSDPLKENRTHSNLRQTNQQKHKHKDRLGSTTQRKVWLLELDPGASVMSPRPSFSVFHRTAGPLTALALLSCMRPPRWQQLQPFLLSFRSTLREDLLHFVLHSCPDLISQHTGHTTSWTLNPCVGELDVV